MESSQAVQDPILTGPDLSALSPKDLAKIEAQVAAEHKFKLMEEERKVALHKSKMQGVTGARRSRVAEGMAKRNQEQIDMIRRMTPGEREHFKARCNHFTKEMLAELARLDGLSPEEQAPAPTSLQSLGQASVQDIEAELHRRRSIIGPPPTQPSSSQPEGEAEEEDDNALSDAPPREKSTVPPAPLSTGEKQPGKPPKNGW